MNGGEKGCFFWLFTCLLLGKQCSAVTKQWLPNTNYNNPANWNKGRVPCDGDNVQLDKVRQDKPLAVSLRNSHTVKSLSLPMNGEVIFYDGAELSFSGTDQDLNACQDSGDIHFVASVQNWYNPYNWQEVTYAKQALTASSVSILHADNVPCDHDTVIFPLDSSFLVKSELPIKVAEVQLFGKVQSSASFKYFYSSNSGSLQFNFTGSTADITAAQCGDPTGCPCGNWKFANTICSHVNCKKPACPDPFKPEGSCCHVCGTLLKLSLGKDFKMDDYRALLLNISQKEYEGVTVATSKTQDGFVQVVLTDQENGKDAQIAAEHLKEVMTSEKAFNVVGTEVLEQSGFKAVPGKKTGKPKNSMIIPLAVGLTLLFLFLVVVIFLIFRRTQRNQEKERKRMRSHSFPLVMMEDDLELAEIDNNQGTGKGAEELEEKQFDQVDPGQMSMENPLYESSTNVAE
ncbi:protein amnionless-like isoform X1 [Oculina patagonica]